MEKNLKILCVGNGDICRKNISKKNNTRLSFFETDKVDEIINILGKHEIDMIFFNGSSDKFPDKKLINYLLHKKKYRTTIENKLKEAQAIAKVGSWELDLINDELFWSDEIFRIFNLDKNKFGASYEAFVDFVHPDDRKIVDQAYQDHLSHKKKYDIEHRILLKNGEIKYVHENCYSKFDKEGNPFKSIGTIQDITDLKMTELELEKHKNNLEELVEERTKELHKANLELKEKTEELEMFNKAMIDREMRIIELKEEVNNLCCNKEENIPYPEIWNE